MKSFFACLLIASALALNACESAPADASNKKPDGYIGDTGIKADGYIQTGGTATAR